MNTFNEENQPTIEEPPTRTHQDTVGSWLEEADVLIRANPIPAILSAVACRCRGGPAAQLSWKRHAGASRCASSWMISRRACGIGLKPWQKKARRAYANSSGPRVGGGARRRSSGPGKDVDPVVAPVAAWWKRFWSCS
jgi:hypothetical protein